tara:strand:+ start:327 stop:1091 length:765 start_codon:yes stop_codon:yes gene_type:complete
MDKHDAPSFQWYPKDFLSDPDVMQMNFAQKGAYIVLISYQWLNDGLPKNTSYIRNLLGGTPKWKQLWDGVKHKFVEIDGKLYNKRLYKERQKQIEHRKTASEAGKKGAEKRWQSHSHPIDSPMAKNGSSSSTSSSTSTAIENPPLTPLKNDGDFLAFDIKKIEKIYPILVSKKEAERWERTGRLMNQPTINAISSYINQTGDMETAIEYAKERKNRKESGKMVSKLENFCKKDWIEYSPESDGDAFETMRSETV